MHDGISRSAPRHLASRDREGRSKPASADACLAQIYSVAKGTTENSSCESVASVTAGAT
jgi:hypothetical protein